MSPAEEYSQRLRALESRIAHLDQASNRISSLRLVIFTVTVLGAGWSLLRDAFSLWWLLLPAAVFSGVAAYHAHVRRARNTAERRAAVYRRGLARIEDRWIGQSQGGSGGRFNNLHHVYAADLDLFGSGSLFELLSIARTRMGENTLAQWLLNPATAETIRERQASVAELAPRLDLREQLATLGEDDKVGVQPDALLAWAEAPSLLKSTWIKWVALLLPLAAVAGAIVWSLWGLASPLLLILLVEAGVLRLFSMKLQRILYSTENAFDDLKLLAALPARLEQETYSSLQLQGLTARLASQDQRASLIIARLGTIVQLIESRRNPLLAVLQVPLMYPLHAAMAAERWRASHGKAVRAWLGCIGEIEALISLSAYAYEHPADVFPQIVAGTAIYEAKELGHPLLAAARCIRNDVTLDQDTRVLLVSGSNMSGKSTLLRSVGVNTVLAMAGAPVRATELRITPLQVGASIRINDSLHEGSSRFYAEITRLQQIHQLSGSAPTLLFLLDEVLQGTNSKDRRIGAEGVVRDFVAHGAIGLISTHDLTLTDLDVGGQQTLRNMHFQDELRDGRMSFDFKLRDGVVTKSNGVELMRAIGLKV